MLGLHSRHVRQRMAVLGITALTAGCVDRSASPFAGLSPDQGDARASAIARDRDDRLTADLQSGFASRAPRNILVLSGGDAHGAFGCGVLAGWRQAGAHPRPVFDIVTGVSTGAMMAAFAFLGEPRDDAELHDVYTSLRDSDVFDGPVGGPPDAVFDTAPLRRLIAKHVTADTIRRIAAAHRGGRRLYVATAELDTGALVTWPMSALAADAVSPNGDVDPAKLARFQSILLAAASIPVLFPPVEIDGGLHVDAGLRAAVVLNDAMLGLTATPTSAPATRPVVQPPDVWAIFNGPLATRPQPVRADLVHIGVRSLGLFTHSIELLSMREIAGVAESHDPRCKFNWIAEPAADAPVRTAPGLAEPMFDPRTTAREYRAGESLGRSGTGWREGPPPMDAGR
jgi:hypothetical protein